MRYLYFLLVCAFLLSCGRNHGRLNEVGLATYNTGFPAAKFKIYDFNGGEYLAFADFVTNKEIVLFDIDGLEQYKTQVKNLSEENGVRFIDFAFCNLDSLLLLGNSNSKIYLIDKSAKLISIDDYTKLIQKKNVELWPPLNFDGGILRVGLSFATAPDERIYNPTAEDMISENIIRQTTPQLFIDSNVFKSTEEYSFHIYSFYQRFSRVDQWPIEGVPIKVLDSITVVASSYSDSLYIFDENYDLQQIVEVSSEYTDPKLPPVTFEKILKDDKAINKNFLDNGFISEIYFDKFRKLYYCFIRHKREGDERPFSIIVFSEKFEQLDEFKIDESKYYNSAFVSKKGLYLLNRNQRSREENSFTIFNYEKK